MGNMITTYLNFLWAGLLKHGQTGGVIPSQKFLIDKMIAPVPVAYRGQIIELGAGTAALTLRLAARCRRAQILSCEINPVLAADCRANLARAGCASRVDLVCASAEQVLLDRGSRGTKKPDFIISGIPFGNLGREKAGRLLDTIRLTLAEGGMFVQFQHSLLDRKKILLRFPNTRTIPVFLNFPPAFVYYAKK